MPMMRDFRTGTGNDCLFKLLMELPAFIHKYLLIGSLVLGACTQTEPSTQPGLPVFDRSPVTVDEFSSFVDATGYVTEAEIIGNAVVFSFDAFEWTVVEGATWRHPLGPGSEPAPGNHPVTQVAYADARAYLEWTGKRLPTGDEWVRAARGDRPDTDRYPWGNSLVINGRVMANTMHEADSFRYTSPVGHFGENTIGLTDMGGNVWEWTAEGSLTGGSFLCDSTFCHGFQIGEISQTDIDNASHHIGFRGVKDNQ
jgi:formylglycine-generating enzyme